MTPKVFKFKQQVLVHLLDPLNVRILRAKLIIFKRARDHHFKYDKHCRSPLECLRFHQFWANMRLWLRDMVIPTVEDAFCAPRNWRYVGVTRSVEVPWAWDDASAEGDVTKKQ